MVYGLHREVKGHKLEDRSEVVEGGADGQAGEPHLRDGRVDDALVSILFPETACDFVCSVVLGNLFSKDENLVKIVLR